MLSAVMAEVNEIFGLHSGAFNAPLREIYASYLI
jgi:hypothetical protein